MTNQNIVKLEDWFLTDKFQNPYIPPEDNTCAKGMVFGHPKHTDGSYIRTSLIIKIENNLIYTESGTVYSVGEPNKSYVNWCEKNGYFVPTKETPFRTKE